MERIVASLDKMNKTLERMLEHMTKQEHPFVKVMTLAGTGVSVLGVIQLIDIVRNWF